MTPDTLGPAIDRLLMLTAGPADDADWPAIRAQLDAFDDDTSAGALACIAAIRAAAVIEALPDDAPGGFVIADPVDLVAFGMLAHANEHGPDRLATHLDGLNLQHRLMVAISLLSMWRQACCARTTVTLADLQLPDTAPTREDT